MLEAGPAGVGTVPRYRPAGERPFDPFVIASVRRMTETGPLLVLGKEERIEANLVPAPDAVLCRDLNGPVLFRLEKYTPSAGAVVAFTDSGEPISTYLPATSSTLEVRDGATAPVATLIAKRGSDDNWDLIERGGQRRLASCWRQHFQLAQRLHEQWFVMPTADGKLPLATMALVALPVVCHAWLGRPSRPVPETEASTGDIDASLFKLFGGWH